MSEEQLGQIIEATHEAIMFADRQGRIRLWNAGCQRLFGFSKAQANGESLDIIIPEHLRKAHWKGFFEAVERGDTLPNRKPATTKALHASGQVVYVVMSFSMVHNRAGEVTGSVAIGRLDEERARRKAEDQKTEKLDATQCPFGGSAA
jgi:PAS domain S-box-containing protein